MHHKVGMQPANKSIEEEEEEEHLCTLWTRWLPLCGGSAGR